MRTTGWARGWVTVPSAVAAVVAVGGLVLAAPATAAGDTFTVDPTSGPPGTTVTLTGVTPCVLPAGVPGPPLVTATLERDSHVLTSARTQVRADGGWSVALTVGASLSPGPLQVGAVCQASPTAEGAVVSYDDVTFTVTGGLANTGAPATVLVVVAGLLLVAGAAATVAGRRSGSARPPATMPR